MTAAGNQKVVVAAEHPVLGLVYWTYCWGGETNSADHWGLTDYSPSALQLPNYWREHDHLSWQHGSHLRQVFNEMDPNSDFQEEEDEEAGKYGWVLLNTLARLQADSGQTVDEFVRWARAADWIDIPAPVEVQEDDE